MRAELAPLNQTLYTMAAKIWNKIRIELREEWAEVLSIRPSRKRDFPLSIIIINGVI